MKLHPWEKEYRERKLVTLGEVASEDAKRFLKWLKKEEGLEVENKLVLDAGCGNGKNAYLFLENGARAVGYDISETAINLANKKLQESEHTDRAKFFIHNMSNSLELEDMSVDIILDITASNALLTSERTVYVKECTRVLKSAGYMFVRTLCKDGDDNAKFLIKNYPGLEKDMYKLIGTDIVERAFTEKDVRETYGQIGEIKFIEKIFHYPKMEGRIYKRAYWLIYLQAR